MGLFWLSFCDGTKPSGSQFLGVAIVESPEVLDIAGAVQEAWRLGINPGGEVMSFPIPERARAEHEPYKNRLLSRLELETAFGRMMNLAEIEAQGDGGGGG